MPKKMKVMTPLLIIMMILTMPVNAVEIYNKNQSKVYLNGRILARHIISDTEKFSGDLSKVRLNLLAETNLHSDINGYMRFEHDFPAFGPEDASKNKDFTRYGYAGLNAGKYGTLNFGRNDGIIYDVSNFTNIFAVYGSVTSQVDNFMMQKSSGLLSYHNNDFFSLVDGLDIGLQLQTRNNSQERGFDRQHGKGYGMSLTWRSPTLPLTLAGAWSRSHHTGKQLALIKEEKDAAAWIVGAKYEPEPFYIAAFYSEMRHMYPYNNAHLQRAGFVDKARLFEGVIRYKTPYKFSLAVGYLQTLGFDIAATGRADLVRMVDLFLVYPFSPQVRATAEYKINCISHDNRLNQPRDNTLVMTLVYDF
jgi:predicted porin